MPPPAFQPCSHAAAHCAKLRNTGIALLLFAAAGCGGNSYSTDTRSERVQREQATYYREQAQQLFGSDLVRVEPLSRTSPQPSYEDFVQMRRELDLRPIAAAAMPQSAPQRAAWAPAAGNDTSWLESDRPEPADRTASSSRSASRADSRSLATSKSDGRAGPSPWERDPNFERQATPAPEGRREPLAASSLERRPDASMNAGKSAMAEMREPMPEAPLAASAPRSGAREAAAPVAASSPAAVPANQGWSIVLAVFRGDDHGEQARIALGRIQSEGGLPQAFVQRAGLSSSVKYGRYTGPEDPTAQADLNRIQEMVINGTRLYGLTYLCPPPEAAVVRNEYDLRTVKKEFGKDALYTLQVGFYGREELDKMNAAEFKEVRAAAEQAVVNLRKEGEMAFFYHGPNRSVVTIGVFDANDFDPQKPGIETARLREARKRHPANLYNGQGYTGKVPGMREAKLVPSSLVAIPNK